MADPIGSVRATRVGEYYYEILRLNSVFCTERGVRLPCDTIESMGPYISTTSHDGIGADKFRALDTRLRALRKARRSSSRRVLDALTRSGAVPAGDLDQSLQTCFSGPMPRYLIPGLGADSPRRIPQPSPGLMYGYHRRVFSPPQETMQGSFREGYNLFRASPNDVRAPFLFVDTEPGTDHKTLQIAINEGIGAAASALTPIEALNAKLISMIRDNNVPEIVRVPDLTYALAANCKYAMLSVVWINRATRANMPLPQSRYCATCIGRYDLRVEAQVNMLHGAMLGILEWGAGRRLRDIKLALGAMVKYDRYCKEREKKMTRRRPAGEGETRSAIAW